MDDSSVVGVLAEALAQHRGGTNHSGDWECSCGKEGPEKSHDAHQASVVTALPNIAIVEHVASTKDEDCGHVWLAGVMAEGFHLAAEPGSICDFGGTEYTVEEARRYAAAMLTAAAAARAAGGQA